MGRRWVTNSRAARATESTRPTTYTRDTTRGVRITLTAYRTVHAVGGAGTCAGDRKHKGRPTTYMRDTTFVRNLIANEHSVLPV